MRFYCEVLAKKGFIASDGRVRISRYSAIVERELKHLQPIWPGLFRDGGSCGSWLGNMSHGREAQDTTFIVLALKVAQGLPDVNQAQDLQAKYFGPGPWPCRNPLAEHFGEPSIHDLVVSKSKGALTGRFSCSCGYIYTQMRRSDGSMDKPRMHLFGETLRPFLLAAIGSRRTAGWTARQVGLDVQTLIRTARRLGIWTPWTLKKSGRGYVRTQVTTVL